MSSNDSNSQISARPGAILVTGANGQLGMELRVLSSAYPQFEFAFLSRDELDIDNKDAVQLIFKRHSPRYCINCAAYTAVDKAESEKQEAYRINGESAGVLAAACKDQNSFLIHISTDYVFNGEAEIPYKEDSPVDPVNIYGASKLEGEQLVLKNNPASIIIRTSWVYSSYGKNFVKTMLRLMKEKKEINVVNDQYGSPTYAADLADAILQIITTLPTHHSPLTTHKGVYHYSNDGVTSWYEFALAIKELSASNCAIHPIPTAQYPTPAKRPLYSVLDTTKIKNVFGVKTKDWKQSLEDCMNKIQNS